MSEGLVNMLMSSRWGERWILCKWKKVGFVGYVW